MAVMKEMQEAINKILTEEQKKRRMRREKGKSERAAQSKVRRKKLSLKQLEYFLKTPERGRKQLPAGS